MNATRLVRLLIVTTTFIASTAHAANGGALIGWGLAASEASAQESQRRWEKESAVLGKILSLAPGYPRIAAHADFPEIAPGTFLLVLGVCPVNEVDGPTDALQALSSAPFWMATRKSAEGACPRLLGWTLKQDLVVPRGPSSLRAALWAKKNSPSGTDTSLLHVYLRNSKLDLVDSQELALDPGCTAKLVRDGDDLRVEPTCGGPGRDPLRFTVADGKIARAPGVEQIPDLQALVLATAGAGAEPQDLLSRWSAEGPGREALVTLPDGYPKVVATDDLPGLPSGSKTVLLALCPASRLAAAREVLTALDPRVRVVSVKARSGQPACPETRVGVRDVRRLRIGDAVLSVALFAIRDDAFPRWFLRAQLRDTKGALLDSRHEDPDSATRDHPGKCSCDALPVLGKGPSASSVKIDHSCHRFTEEDQGSAPFDVHVVYTVQGNRIVETVRKTEP